MGGIGGVKCSEKDSNSRRKGSVPQMVTRRCFPAYVCSHAFTTRVRLYRTCVRSIRTRVFKMRTNICGNSSELPPGGHSLFLGSSCFLCTYFSLNLCYLLYDSTILFYDAGPILFFRDSSPAGPVPFPESSGSEFISI